MRRAAVPGSTAALLVASLVGCQSREPAVRRWDTSQGEFHFTGPAVLAFANPGQGGGIHGPYLKRFPDEFDVAADSLERAGYSVGVSFRDKILVIEGSDTFGLEGPPEQDPAAYYFFAPGRQPHAVAHELRAGSLLAVLHSWEHSAEAAPPAGREALYFQIRNQRILVTDPHGHRAGYDSAGRPPLREIPHSGYEERSTGLEWVAIVMDSDAAPGTYEVAVLGGQPGAYELTALGVGPAAIRTPVGARGITDGATASRFRLQYSAGPGVPLVWTPVVIFASTLRDIAASRDLGLIDDQAVATALTEQIKAAQSARELGDERASATTLDAFRSLLQAQRAHLHPFAARVLADDAALLGRP